MNNEFENDFLEEEDELEGTMSADIETLNTSGAVNPQAGTAMESVYDQYKKLYLAVDNSGSMTQKMLPDFKDIQISVTPDDIAVVREVHDSRLQGKKSKYLDRAGYPEFDARLPLWLDQFGPASDESIRRALLSDVEMACHFGCSLAAGGKEGATKLDALKDLIKDAARKRFEKYPDSKISVVPFDYTPKIVPVSDLEGAGLVLDTMHASGGTNITQALMGIVKNCKKAPSPVNLHHIILVTDGEDMGVLYNKAEIINALKENGFVLDVISIYADFEILSGRGNYCAEIASEGKKALLEICESTGGTFTNAKTSGQMAALYLAASSRLMLPPGN